MTKLTKKDKERLRSVNLNSEGYKTSSKTTHKGFGTQTEHFDGRQDVEIRPKAVEMKATKTGDH